MPSWNWSKWPAECYQISDKCKIFHHWLMNGLLHVLSAGKSLEFSHFVSILRLHKRMKACISKQNKSLCFILHWKWYDSKTSLAGLEIPVQKPNAKDRCSSTSCTSIHTPVTYIIWLHLTKLLPKYIAK